MNRYAIAVAVCCLLTACSVPTTTLVAASGEPPALETDVPHRNGSGVDPIASMGPASGERDRLLLEALRKLSSAPADREGLRVFVAFEDLNKDGVHEAVVHVTGTPFCGTGGCTTMVYQWDSRAAAYTRVDHSPTTRPPIYVSAREGCQWSMLWVKRSGGGRSTELHSPNLLTPGETCDAPVVQWNEAGSKLLIPVFESRDEGTRL